MGSQKHKLFIGYTTRLFSDGLEAMVKDFEEIECAHSAPIGESLAESIAIDPSIEILILEVNCPSKVHLDIIQNVRHSFPYLKILLLSLLPRKEIGIDLIDSGIFGYLLKSCGKEDLRSALDKIIQNMPYICADISKSLLIGKRRKQEEENKLLTDREKEVLSLLVNNTSNKQIAQSLKISENTVKTHRRNIHSKFGVSNLIGLVRYACRSNLIDFGDDGYCMVCPYVN